MSPTNLSRHVVTVLERGAPPVPPDPILAAIAAHRRLWDKSCAVFRDVEQAGQLKTQTHFFQCQLAALIAERERIDKAKS